MNLSPIIKIPQKLVLFILCGYSNYVSYFFPSICRFYPSCSHYAQDAVKTYGVFRGGYYSLRRLLRCHPWHQGGHDPVPKKTKIPSVSCCAEHTRPQTTSLVKK